MVIRITGIEVTWLGGSLLIQAGQDAKSLFADGNLSVEILGPKGGAYRGFGITVAKAREMAAALLTAAEEQEAFNAVQESKEHAG